MAKYIVYISKTIDAGFLVEADSEQEALDASFDMNDLVELSDGGWDVAYNAEKVNDDMNIKPLTATEIKHALADVSIL